jgi:hypothetical protein
VEEVSVLLKFQGFRVSRFQSQDGCLQPPKVLQEHRECSYGKKPRLSPFRLIEQRSSSQRTRHNGLTSQTGLRFGFASNLAEAPRQINSRRIPALPRPSARLSTELDTQLAIALDLTYLKPDRFEILDREIYQVLGLLNRLIDSLRKRRDGPVSKP